MRASTTMAFLIGCGALLTSGCGSSGEKCADVTCAALDACHDVGVCDPDTGACSNPVKVVCTALDLCHDAGVCDPNTGICSNPAKVEGAACGGVTACTDGTCQAGVCIGSTPGPLCFPAFVPLPGAPNDVVYDSARGRAYVSNPTLNRIEVVNLQAGVVEAAIPVGGSPRGLAIAPDGHTLLATLFDTWQMAVVDLDTRAQVSAIPLHSPGYGSGFGPLRVDFDAAGTCIWRDGTEAHAFGYAYILDLGTGASRPLVSTEPEMLRYAPSFDRSRLLLMFNSGRASVWSAHTQSSAAPVPIPGFSGDWWDWMNQGAINNSGELVLLSTYGATKAYDASFAYLGSVAEMAWGTFGPWRHLALVVPGSDELPSDTVSLVDLGSFHTLDSLVLPERLGHGEYNFGGQPMFLTADGRQLFVVGQTGLFAVDTSRVAE